QVVADPGDVRRDLEAVGQPDPGHLSERGVGLLRRGGVDADAHAPLLRTRVHRRCLGLLRHRLAALPHQLTNGWHRSCLGPPRPSMGPKPYSYTRGDLSCQYEVPGIPSFTSPRSYPTRNLPNAPRGDHTRAEGALTPPPLDFYPACAMAS